MRSIAIVFALIACTGVYAEPSIVERLKRELKVAAPPEHYPDHADYRLFPAVCNPRICFLVLAVQFDSARGSIVRVAIFSESEHYLGSYAGLTTAPQGVDGPVLYFPGSAQVNAIRFDRTSPPPEIHVDGRHYAFQRAR